MYHDTTLNNKSHLYKLQIIPMLHAILMVLTTVPLFFEKILALFQRIATFFGQQINFKDRIKTASSIQNRLVYQ